MNALDRDSVRRMIERTAGELELAPEAALAALIANPEIRTPLEVQTFIAAHLEAATQSAAYALRVVATRYLSTRRTR